MDKNLVLYQNKTKSWFYNSYFANGGNNRYYTFQIALNLLQQWHPKPTIIETGCQRLLEDLGGGMSTSIFAEYIDKYGGKLITVDNSLEHLKRAEIYTIQYESADIDFVHSDSVSFLENYKDDCNLLYLDSLDYPIDGNKVAADEAEDHCMSEFFAIGDNLKNKSILLVDDNIVAGINGGKPAKLRHYLTEHEDWTCIFEMQQTLWVKGL